MMVNVGNILDFIYVFYHSLSLKIETKKQKMNSNLSCVRDKLIKSML